MAHTQRPPDPRGPAIVLAHRGFDTTDGKTVHGLVRGSDRFEVGAVVDPDLAGQDAGEALDGQHRGIPITATVAEALDAADGSAGKPPEFCVIGVATLGGRLSDELRQAVGEAMDLGLSIVNGLHEFLSDDAELVARALELGVDLIDIRRPLPRTQLHFWSGEILQVRAPRVAVLGMDCSIGKRTTTRMLAQALGEAGGVRAEMIYTGQTGWMQGARYGFILDSMPNDFVCGELERAIVACDREAQPEVMLVEGQSALRNPSGPCGSELLLSAAAAGVVLQHAPGRELVEDFEDLGLRIPSVESEVELIAAYGVPTLAIALNSHGSSMEALVAEQERLRQVLGIPVVRPLEEGVDELVPVIERLLGENPGRPGGS